MGATFVHSKTLGTKIAMAYNFGSKIAILLYNIYTTIFAKIERERERRQEHEWLSGKGKRKLGLLSNLRVFFGGSTTFSNKWFIPRIQLAFLYVMQDFFIVFEVILIWTQVYVYTGVLL